MCGVRYHLDLTLVDRLRCDGLLGEHEDGVAFDSRTYT